jgi:hypothetical protein
MTRYALDKVLWEYARDDGFRNAFDADAEAAIAARELDDAERAALASKDIRAIFECRAHPFLIYGFAIALNRGWSFDMMRDYVARLEGLELGDVET